MDGAKNYELVALFSSSLPEEEILTWPVKLGTFIEDAKGVIKNIDSPQKRQLAYPVKKEKTAYFIRIVFTIAPEFISALEKKLKNLDKLLRYTIVEEVKVEVRPQPLRIITPRIPSVRPRAIPREVPKTDEKLDLEALDKKLEEILGK